MSPVDWRKLAREAGFRVAPGDTVTISLDGGTAQTVSIDERRSDAVLRAHSVIASQRLLTGAIENGSPLRYAWARNRLSDLFAFEVDARGRLIGVTWIPLDGLTSAEFGIYVWELGRICDWHEFRLAGQDEH
jgi:hypothetical protein